MTPSDTPDPIVAAVCADLQSRSAVGLRKYGVGLDRGDLTAAQWAEHAYHEALDLALYLKRLGSELGGGATDEPATSSLDYRV